MEWNKTTTRNLTKEEKRVLDLIYARLGSDTDAIMLEYVKIKSSTCEGFFERINKAMFNGLLSTQEELRGQIITLSNSTWLAAQNISPKTKRTKKFNSLAKGVILKGLKLASRLHLNIDDFIESFNPTIK